MIESKDCLVHWTDKKGFDGIVGGERILGLTEGRVYLHKGNSAPRSICGKKYRIVLKGFNFAERHPARKPPSWWSLFKLSQWVSPLSSNIVWDLSKTHQPNSRTLVVCHARIEAQDGFAKYSGLARFWLRWFAIDWLPIWVAIFLLSVDLDSLLSNSEYYSIYLVVGAVLAPIAALVLAWYHLQKKVNGRVIKQYRSRKVRSTRAFGE
ncbi:hypothetical protein DSM109990_01352 [Sulfitobacter dubius]|uniref:Uncharacterized protein n=1 Tax=Sulfitobacter dubius TaxID=218673 RepID=A0ABY3ZLK9_9RHOB|nr:hypothetical protein DSM109990_01352 [Sulfitobacter dubius]